MPQVGRKKNPAFMTQAAEDLVEFFVTKRQITFTGAVQPLCTYQAPSNGCAMVLLELMITRALPASSAELASTSFLNFSFLVRGDGAGGYFLSGPAVITGNASVGSVPWSYGGFAVSAEGVVFMQGSGPLGLVVDIQERVKVRALTKGYSL